MRIIILELILKLNQVLGRMKAPTPQPKPPEIPAPAGAAGSTGWTARSMGR